MSGALRLHVWWGSLGAVHTSSGGFSSISTRITEMVFALHAGLLEALNRFVTSLLFLLFPVSRSIQLIFGWLCSALHFTKVRRMKEW